MLVTRRGFRQVVSNAFAGMGFPAEAPYVYEFPMEMFIAGSDLTPVRQNIDKIVFGLTQWQPKITKKGVYHPDLITVQGKTYPQALDTLNNLFVRNMWSDQLPFVPPTADRVKWILTGTDLAPDTVISPPGGVLARGGIADVTSIAVALAMANGRPEYLPFLIAAVQALTDPVFGLAAANPTTSSVIPAVIVNGPNARQVRLGSGYGLLGPDPLHPAGQVIGRALRLIQMDLGGAVPGVGTMAIFGGMRATNAVFAEDEAGLPKGWNSLAVERGFATTDDVVTVTPVGSMENMSSLKYGTKELNEIQLYRYGKYMSGTPDLNSFGSSTAKVWNSPDVATGVALVPRGFAEALASVSGYSKLDVKTALWNQSKLPWDVAVKANLADEAVKVHQLTAGKDIPLTPNPKGIMIVVAGGEQSGHGYWMKVGHSNYTTVSKKVQLPKAWNALLKQAETDLGPIPAAN